MKTKSSRTSATATISFSRLICLTSSSRSGARIRRAMIPLTAAWGWHSWPLMRGCCKLKLLLPSMMPDGLGCGWPFQLNPIPHRPNRWSKPRRLCRLQKSFTDRPDVVAGHHDVIEPDLAHMPGRSVGDVEIGPDEIHIQFLRRSPTKPFKWLAAGGSLKIFPIALLLVPADAFAALILQEFIEDPFALGKSFAEVAD